VRPHCVKSERQEQNGTIDDKTAATYSLLVGADSNVKVAELVGDRRAVFNVAGELRVVLKQVERQERCVDRGVGIQRLNYV